MKSIAVANVFALVALASSVFAAPPNDMSPILRRQVEAEFAGLVMRSATDLQSFTGALGGIKASPITQSGDSQRPFEVDGNTFVSQDFFELSSKAGFLAFCVSWRGTT